MNIYYYEHGKHKVELFSVHEYGTKYRISRKLLISIKLQNTESAV